MSSFTEFPVLKLTTTITKNFRYFRKIKRSYSVEKPFQFYLNDLRTGKIVIEKGFKTDLSSIPEVWWSVQKPFGDFILAPIVHDWMYRTKYRKEELGTYGARLHADKMMLYISKKTNSMKWHNKLDNHARYWAVRAFGWITYKFGM